jgi:2-dehydropantoate 2-reductase
MRRLNVPVLGSVINFGARRLFNRRPIIFSLQQDLERSKPTEVDYVNGEIVRLAKSVGEAAPRNALVVSFCHELESRHDGTFFSREEVIRRFGALG